MTLDGVSSGRKEADRASSRAGARAVQTQEDADSDVFFSRLCAPASLRWIPDPGTSVPMDPIRAFLAIGRRPCTRSSSTRVRSERGCRRNLRRRRAPHRRRRGSGIRPRHERPQCRAPAQSGLRPARLPPLPHPGTGNQTWVSTTSTHGGTSRDRSCSLSLRSFVGPGRWRLVALCPTSTPCSVRAGLAPSRT